MAPTPPLFDVTSTTAQSLQWMLENGRITSLDIVEEYLKQISLHNNNGLRLNALISVAGADTLVRTAKELDDERSKGKVRSQFHGLPIVIKDVFHTAPELDLRTTCGSHAFRDAKSTQNAELVQRLLDAGLIVIATANLTEFCGMKQSDPRVPGMVKPGWSSFKGQTQSAYVEGGLRSDDGLMGHSSPLGSSAGSGVAVAAGFAPLSIGTETVGSLTMPAIRSGLYALKLSRKQQPPSTGMFTISESFDCMGCMAKSSHDLETLVQIIVGPTMMQTHLRRSGTNIKIGFVDSADPMWQFPDAVCPENAAAKEQIISTFRAAAEKLSETNFRVTKDVELRDPNSMSVEGTSGFHFVSFAEFEEQIERFLGGFDPSTCSIRTLDDMILWNKEHADIALPEPYTSQEDLIQASISSKRTTASDQEKVTAAREKMLQFGGPEGIQQALRKYDLDVIVAPGDSSLCSLAAAAGYAVAAAPLGQLDVEGLPKRPLGICAVAGELFAEENLLAFLSVWEERVCPNRPLPLDTLRPSMDE